MGAAHRGARGALGFRVTVRILQGRYKVKANTDIWDVIRATREAKRLQVAVEWVRGHAGDPRNELADRLSKLGALNGHIEELGTPPVASPVERLPAELAGLEPRGEWEREFLSSVAQQLRRGRVLTPKQQDLLTSVRQLPPAEWEKIRKTLEAEAAMKVYEDQEIQLRKLEEQLKRRDN